MKFPPPLRYALFRRTAATLMALVFGSAVQVQSAQAQSGKEPSGRASQPAIIQSAGLVQPATATQGMVVSQHYLASETGAGILRQGGNAVDAAVATAFALAVVLPRAGNLAGGGFMLVHLAKENRTVAVDYREMAPAAAHRNMFIGPDGEADNRLSRFTHLAAGVPGTVAGLHHAWRKHGSLPWKKLLAPAITLAQRGFAVSRSMHRSLARAKHLQSNAAARAVFYDTQGQAPAAGTLLRQRELAATLKRIQKLGPSGFYRGPTADAIVAEMQRGGGLITHRDLANYRVVERKPVVGLYRGLTVKAMPPPSSGGVHLIQMLNVLEGYDLSSLGKGSAAGLHLLAEAMKPAYSDRARHLGDPDFHRVPVGRLMSKAYADELRERISPEQARPSGDIAPLQVLAGESEQTTHFSVVDKAGNAVSNTYTLNFSYGSGIMVPGAGILLNNEMDDFSARPGQPNAYGLLGGEANAVQSHKRPLSSMTPTMVFSGDKLKLVTGSPGGSLIITAVLQHIVDVFDHGLNIAESVHRPRIHHQWLPEILFHERGFSPDTLNMLQQKGHRIQQVGFRGSLESIAITEDGLLLGAPDPRQPDGRASGH